MPITAGVLADVRIVADHASTPVEELTAQLPLERLRGLRDKGLVMMWLRAWPADSSGQRKRAAYVNLNKSGNDALAPAS